MSDNVVILDVQTSLDLPVERVLGAAVEAGLERVTVIGVEKDGVLYFASSVANGPKMLWDIERAKRELFKAADD